MAPGARVNSLTGTSLSPLNIGLCSLIFITCGACSHQRPPSPTDSTTVYLKSADSYLVRTDSQTHRKSTSAPAKARPSPTSPESTPSPTPLAIRRVPVRTIPPVDESIASLRERLLGRIEHLSNEEADQVCLSLEFIPREQVFDRRINPKKLLLGQASRATSRQELESIEQTINELRR